MAIICIVFSVTTILILPYTGSIYSSKGETSPRWKRMDIIGVTILMGALICFILSLTQGPIGGWSSIQFIVPFVLAWPLTILFFYWGQFRVNDRSKYSADSAQNLASHRRQQSSLARSGRSPTSSSPPSPSSSRSVSGLQVSCSTRRIGRKSITGNQVGLFA